MMVFEHRNVEIKNLKKCFDPSTILIHPNNRTELVHWEKLDNKTFRWTEKIATGNRELFFLCAYLYSINCYRNSTLGITITQKIEFLCI